MRKKHWKKEGQFKEEIFLNVFTFQKSTDFII